MTKELEFFEMSPLSKENPKKLMIFLHGYGASGKDLIGLAKEFQYAIPTAHFISPNAPIKIDHTFGVGYQWFSLDNYDPTILYPQIMRANQALDKFIASQLNRFSLTYQDLFLTGFSQGSMMAMYNSLRNSNQNAGLISYSGRLILPTTLGESIKSKPKICLVHGTNDDVLPFSDFLEAKKQLQNLEIPVESYSLEGLGHSIDNHGIKIGREFLANI